MNNEMDARTKKEMMFSRSSFFLLIFCLCFIYCMAKLIAKMILIMVALKKIVTGEETLTTV